MANGNQVKAKIQHERFLETARSLACDEDEAAFDEKLKVIARQKPRSDKSERPKSRADK